MRIVNPKGGHGEQAIGHNREQTEKRQRDRAGAGNQSPSALWDHRSGEGVEGEGAEEVAAHAGFDLAEAAGGGIDPFKGHRGGEGGELVLEVDVADEVWSVRLEEEQVFEEGSGGAEQRIGFLLTFGSGAIRFGDFE